MYSPRFSITPNINNQIAEIERFRLIVERSNILPTKEVVLRRRAAIEATRSSTGIEGNPLTVDEVEQVLSGKKVSASARFVTEVLNYKKSLDHIEQRARNKSQITLQDILGIHSTVMKGLLPTSKIGVFRKTPIYVVDFKNGVEEVRYEGPNSKEVQKLIQHLLDWLYADESHIHPLLKAGIFHYEFVSIHPFADGNGRVTRLLTLLYLYQSGYAFRHILVPDGFYFENRPRYYASLNQAKKYEDQRKADLTPWLSYFIEGLHEVVNDMTQKILSVALTDNRREVLTMTPKDFDIIEYISTVGKATTEDIAISVKVSKRTTQRRLSRLVAAGLLARFGKGPSTTYQLKKGKAL